MSMLSTQIPMSRRRPGIGRIARFLSVWRQRRALERLDDAALEDIGVSREAAEAEAARPFWDAPDTWRD
ncbi:DUF1127 domain-containing protein [Lutimaribacter marinistellae]|uniref:DUF1127 domain-containing protein n=1 Tax=Lutimaribacter marinistellae TaxID=1820329 RepID=A0ABV7TIT1_9RHOB